MTRQMKHFNFPVRNLDGTFYAQVHPFDHPTSLSRCTPVGLSCSHPITCNSPCYNILLFNHHSWSSQPVQFLADIPKYWLENDGTMCLDDSHRWQSEETIAWLRKHGLHAVPNSIKAEIGDLVYNGPKKKSLDEPASFAPPPGRFVYFTGSRASNDPPPGLWICCRCPVG